MIILIDNYDSFTFNLVHYLGGLGADVVVHRNDKISVDAVMALEPEGVVLSPGPAKASATIPSIPILGVCLGHQAMGQAFGGKVIRAPQMVHGKVSQISHDATGVFRGINGPFQATRYHSLIVERASMPRALKVNAQTADGLVMGMMHESLPLHGVQFHPESIASEHGHLMLRNFLEIAAAWNVSHGRASSSSAPKSPPLRAASAQVPAPPAP